MTTALSPSTEELRAAGLTPAAWTALRLLVVDGVNDVHPGSGPDLFTFAIGEVEAERLIECGYGKATSDRFGNMRALLATPLGRRTHLRLSTERPRS